MRETAHGIAPTSPRRLAPLRIESAVPLERFRVRLVLTDGRKVERDLDGLLRGPVFEPIRASEELFRAVRAEGGTLVWPNAADLDPDVVIWGGRRPVDASHPPQTLALRVPQ